MRLYMAEKNNFEKQLFALTTILHSELTINTTKYTFGASGFYYTETSCGDQQVQGPHWEKNEKHWLITNKHFLFPKLDDKTEHFIDSLTFNLRQVVNGKVEWIPIELNKEQLAEQTLLHNNIIVDVVAIDVTKQISDTLMKSIKSGNKSIIVPSALTKKNLPDNQPLTIDVTTDIIVASYPKGFYDEFNKFPIVKSGIVASGWGFHFNGDPLFEIDAQLFPGSSGGLVISKPTNIAMINGSLSYAHDKQFVLLGIYSGEYFWKEKIKMSDGHEETMERSYGLGNVWYSYLIPEIIETGHRMINFNSPDI